jgi:hypothetical protein
MTHGLLRMRHPVWATTPGVTGERSGYDPVSFLRTRHLPDGS